MKYTSTIIALMGLLMSGCGNELSREQAKSAIEARFPYKETHTWEYSGAIFSGDFKKGMAKFSGVLDYDITRFGDKTYLSKGERWSWLWHKIVVPDEYQNDITVLNADLDVRPSVKVHLCNYVFDNIEGVKNISETEAEVIANSNAELTKAGEAFLRLGNSNPISRDAMKNCRPWKGTYKFGYYDDGWKIESEKWE